MPRAIAVPMRQSIIEQHQQGQSLARIAAERGMPCASIYRVWSRFRHEGQAGLAIHYERCGPSERLYPSAVQEAALSLKREHPRWGGGLIRVELSELLAGEPLPGVRTLQTWFREAGLQPPRAQRPPVQRSRARQPHQVWELDAKERLRLADGSGVSTMSVVDEASGALLDVAVFPPLPLDAGAGGRRSGGPSPRV